MISNIETSVSSNGLTKIEPLAKSFADARAELADAVAALNDIITEAQRRALPKLKRLVAAAAEQQVALKNAIEAAPELFEKPRTVVLHGVQVGLRKGAGGIAWDDDAKVVELIEKKLPAELHEVLIHTEKTPIKKALSGLDVADLKKIGCTVEGTSDVVVIKPTDSAVTKLINRLLAAATKVEEVK
jgi:hypothetical protein